MVHPDFFWICSGGKVSKVALQAKKWISIYILEQLIVSSPLRRFSELKPSER